MGGWPTLRAAEIDAFDFKGADSHLPAAGERAGLDAPSSTTAAKHNSESFSDR